ncbi:MAG: ribonuclease III [Deltaproteobacteria bacterium]|nr:ribonuclease III [Deltaproteobacteria bacterium]
MAPNDSGAPLVADPLGSLAERLGFAFPDRALALAALTHKSYVNEHRDEGLSDNERLEFLGDAVLDLAVSQLLMDRFPQAREGDLSKIRAALVDEPALARQGRALGLGPLLRLGRGEVLTGGRDKASLLADALEAVIAVMYLCGGIEPVLRFLATALAESFASASAGTLDRDYKTQLQEAAQSRLRATPRYRVVAQTGPDHEKVFEVELELRGEVLGRGSGRSKKDAEQVAARQGLEALARGSDGSGGPLATPPPLPAVTPALDAVAVIRPDEAAEAAREAPSAQCQEVEVPVPLAVSGAAVVAAVPSASVPVEPLVHAPRPAPRAKPRRKVAPKKRAAAKGKPGAKRAPGKKGR